MTIRIDPQRYLAYGGVAPAASLDGTATLAYLRSKGFGGNYLEQSRMALSTRAAGEFTFDPLIADYCDFCARPLMGGEFDRLQDGRDRCITCTKTAVTTREEFARLFQEVRRNLEVVFEIQYRAGITVRMENARAIARHTKERFEPTPGYDGRVLGYAAQTPHGFDLRVENGAPKLPSIQTMAHELTHIWQYSTWDQGAIRTRYGAHELAMYEGMACWAMIQYLYSTREAEFATREAAMTRSRTDEYGVGFRLFEERYPLRTDGGALRDSPFARGLPL